jgi:thiol-disulfide isomerase/thioredoxin
VTPVGTPGGLGPSPPLHHLPSSRSTAEADRRELHWITELGGFLTIHDSHGYSQWEKLAKTDTVVRGRTVIGLYFSADWCQPCKLFTPLLKKLHASTRAHCTDANKNIPPFEIVLVSRCKEAKDTERYFADMPWAAMKHDSATLVLLDGEGALICNCGQEHLRTDPTGKGFPWPAPTSGPRPAQVGFVITPLAEVLPKKPTGKPPPFPQTLRSAAGLPVGRPVRLQTGSKEALGATDSDQATGCAGTSERHPGTIQQSPTTATPRSSTR